MTLEQRIEAATKAWVGSITKRIDWEKLSALDKAAYIERFVPFLKAFAPELFADPPTGWIAPTVLSEEDEPAADLQFDIPHWYGLLQARHPMKPTEATKE